MRTNHLIIVICYALMFPMGCLDRSKDSAIKSQNSSSSKKAPPSSEAEVASDLTVADLKKDKEAMAKILEDAMNDIAPGTDITLYKRTADGLAPFEWENLSQAMSNGNQVYVAVDSRSAHLLSLSVRKAANNSKIIVILKEYRKSDISTELSRSSLTLKITDIKDQKDLEARLLQFQQQFKNELSKFLGYAVTDDIARSQEAIEAGKAALPAAVGSSIAIMFSSIVAGIMVALFLQVVEHWFPKVIEAGFGAMFYFGLAASAVIILMAFYMVGNGVVEAVRKSRLQILKNQVEAFKKRTMQANQQLVQN